MQSVQLREIRRADPQGQGLHSFTRQQQTRAPAQHRVRRLFYARAKKGKAGYPRFKSYPRFHQVGFVVGDGAKWTPAAAGGWARAAFQAVGSVKVRQHRPVAGTIKFLQLKREHRRWFAIVVTEAIPNRCRLLAGAVGVDVGVARFLTTSDGELIANPKVPPPRPRRSLTCSGARTGRGAALGNRRRLRRALAKEWRKVRNRRRDFTTRHSRPGGSCDVIAWKNITIASMTGAPSPKPDPGQPGVFLPNMAAAKAGLNKAILDAGWARSRPSSPPRLKVPDGEQLVREPSRHQHHCHLCGRHCTEPQDKTR
jgi:putative transposase